MKQHPELNTKEVPDVPAPKPNAWPRSSAPVEPDAYGSTTPEGDKSPGDRRDRLNKEQAKQYP
jgi:hypothetical protein